MAGRAAANISKFCIKSSGVEFRPAQANAPTLPDAYRREASDCKAARRRL
jgi:hypothetical protein